MSVRGKWLAEGALAIVSILPTGLPLSLAMCSVVAMLLLVTDHFYLPLLLGLGVPAVCLTLWLLGRLVVKHSHAPKRGRRQLIDLLVLLGIGLWTAWNVPLATQHLLTDRDPATYAVTGAWLIHHADLHIPQPAVVREVPGLTASSLGFGDSLVKAHEVFAQGAHLVPALLGALGKVFGLTFMLHANVLFGAVALVGFYGFARLVISYKWAAIATGALALSLPFIYFSRDTYTEPLSLMAVFGSLSCLCYGVRSGRWQWWLLAGVAGGTAVLARADAYAFFASLELFVAVYLATATAADRRAKAWQVLSFLASGMLLCMLGWVDVSSLSSGYYHDLRPHILGGLVLTLTVGLAGLIGGYILSYTALPAKLRPLLNHWLTARMFLGLFGLFFAWLLVRALGLFVLAARGQADTLPVELYASRTTVLWLLWYIGPVLAVGGIVMLGYGWTRVMQGRNQEWLPLLLVLSAAIAMYILNPQISADQIWASRRFLPVIFPGCILLGCWGLERLRSTLPATIFVRGSSTRIGVVLLASLALLSIALTSLPFWQTPLLTQLAAVQRLWSELEPSAVVVWVGQEGGFLTQPVQAVCGASALSVANPRQPLAAILPALRAAAAKQGKVLYVGARSSEAELLPDTGQALPAVTFGYTEPEHTYKKFPLHTVSHVQTIVLRKI